MFSDWLKIGLSLISKKPVLWLMYCVIMYPLLALGSISQFLGITIAVICLFVGVGIAAYSDTDLTDEKSSNLSSAIKQSLPLAIIAGVVLMVCWFLFRAIADLLSGDFGNIVKFFWENEVFTPEFLAQPPLIIAGKIYAVAMVALMFCILMLTTFGSWFSYTLMVYKNSRWSATKHLGNQLGSIQKNAMSHLMLFLGISMVLGLSMMPFFTPQVFAMTSILMYVSYRQIFASSI